MPAGIAALIVVPVVALFVGLEALHQIDSLQRVALAPGSVPTSEIVWVNLGYGILATVFLVVGLAAVFDGLWSMRARRNAAPAKTGRPLLAEMPTPPPERGEPLRAGADIAFRALEAELRLVADRLSPPAVVAFHGVLERARRRAFLELPSGPPNRSFPPRSSEGEVAPEGSTGLPRAGSGQDAA
ncbi:hypothetical protein [Deferrisoma camini]|uniref:hypothetical protein n=1 Tax=Deferrisoma camini TaxID=1035120 RepID=UPI00046D8836|nr:hypothetical protein [Deferrisoma camini]